jgi:hypothetical protein
MRGGDILTFAALRAPMLSVLLGLHLFSHLCFDRAASRGPNPLARDRQPFHIPFAAAHKLELDLGWAWIAMLVELLLQLHSLGLPPLALTLDLNNGPRLKPRGCILPNLSFRVHHRNRLTLTLLLRLFMPVFEGSDNRVARRFLLLAPPALLCSRLDSLGWALAAFCGLLICCCCFCSCFGC